MNFGAHISIAGGIENVPLSANKLGCECFQIFVRPPQGGKMSNLSDRQVEIFKKNLKKAKIFNFYIHAAYFANLASSSNKIFYGAIKALRDDLETGSRLGAKYLMAHLGSAKDLGKKESIKRASDGIKKVLNGYNGKTKFLIENSAGAGQVIGDRFEEIAEIISEVNNKNLAGICFDTAHAFESGYDLRDAEAQKNTFDLLDKKLGLDKIQLFHGNDSITELRSHKDRHANIGKGKLGLEAFREILHNPKFKDIDLILETPGNKEKEEIKMLKNL